MFPSKSIAAEHKDLIQDVAYDFHGKRMATCSCDQHVKVSRSYYTNIFLHPACELFRAGCGLGRVVSVSRRSRDVLTFRLGLVSDKIFNVSVSSWFRSNMSRPSRFRFKSRAIASRRDVLCRRAPCII